MRALTSAIVLLLSLATSACGQIDGAYFREGIGGDLYRSEVEARTAAQDAYVHAVCEQAGLGAAASCDPDAAGAYGWTSFVQAGMNDIDQRCDAYLVWLDGRRRSREPVLQEISDLRTATAAILVATGAGIEPLAVAAAAFGFASSSFTNLNNSLVFALDQSTVQSVVLANQARFRASLPGRIDNRSAALFALRSYLRLCMPMTIDTQVNTTVRLFERSGRLDLGAIADARDHPLISGAAVRTAIITDPGAPLRPSTLAPTRRADPDAAPADVVPVGPYERFLATHAYDLKAIQRKACLPPDGRFTAATRNAILAFLRRSRKDRHFPDEITIPDGTYLRFVVKPGQC